MVWPCRIRPTFRWREQAGSEDCSRKVDRPRGVWSREQTNNKHRMGKKWERGRRAQGIGEDQLDSLSPGNSTAILLPGFRVLLQGGGSQRCQARLTFVGEDHRRERDKLCLYELGHR